MENLKINKIVQYEQVLVETEALLKIREEVILELDKGILYPALSETELIDDMIKRQLDHLMDEQIAFMLIQRRNEQLIKEVTKEGDLELLKYYMDVIQEEE